MFIRFSTENDRPQIKRLLDCCFGPVENQGAYDNLTGRYLLAFDDDTLAAMTGLQYNEEYKGFELDWTATYPTYQNFGIMRELISRICTITDEWIYCSAWRIDGKEKANLQDILEEHGFKEVVRDRITLDSRYNCYKVYCPVKKNPTSNFCKCHEDLWARPERSWKKE